MTKREKTIAFFEESLPLWRKENSKKRDEIESVLDFLRGIHSPDVRFFLLFIHVMPLSLDELIHIFGLSESDMKKMVHDVKSLDICREKIENGKILYTIEGALYPDEVYEELYETFKYDKEGRLDDPTLSRDERIARFFDFHRSPKNQAIFLGRRRLYHYISHFDRFFMVWILSFDSFNASELRQALGLSQPLISQQLRALEESNLIIAERRGRFTFYSIADSTLTIFFSSFACHVPFLRKQTEKINSF